MVSDIYDNNNFQQTELAKLLIWGGAAYDETVVYNLVDRDDVQATLPPDRFIIEVRKITSYVHLCMY